MQWFDVDKAGLAKLLERRGKQFMLYELISNAWDQSSSSVRVLLTKPRGERLVNICVKDDDPQGFQNLSHAFTLFAPSSKLNDPDKRGRFNLGEKLVLAMCESAVILTTTGGYHFDGEGRHTLRRRTPVGSSFEGQVRLTNDEFDQCVESLRLLIPPEGEGASGPKTTVGVIRGDAGSFEFEITAPPLLRRVPAVLPTEIADMDGILRRRERQTTVRIYDRRPGETGMLYEMGIPVVELGENFPYHVNVGQKVPLNMERDNVNPAYARRISTIVLNAMHDSIQDADIGNAGWVRDALGDTQIEPAAVKSMIGLRFGGKAVTYDPSDPESNKRAVAAGYVVVHGPQLTSCEWANVRTAGVLPPAGKVTPSPKPYSDDPDAPPVKVISLDEMTRAELLVIPAVRDIATAMLGFAPNVRLVDTHNHFDAAYGTRTLDLNRRRLGTRWFDDCVAIGQLTPAVISLVIHEVGHEKCGDHLSSQYYRALTDYGATLTLAVAADPTLLRVG